MHKSRLCYITIDHSDHEKAIAFWSVALGAEKDYGDDWLQSPYRRLRIPHQNIYLLLQLVPERKTAKSRIHIDIESDNIDAKADRLEQIGANRVEHKDELGFQWWVMTDPFGNEFCILQPEFKDKLAAEGNTWKS